MSICVLGSVNVDRVHRVARLPTPGETVMAGDGVRLAGGKGANQAVAAARLDARVEMIGAVGDDADGALMLAHLRDAGIEVGAVTVEAGVATGQAFIAVDPTGQNMIFVSAGANARVGYTRGGEHARVFLAQLEVPVAAIATLFATDAARAGLTILNAAPALAEARDLMRICDIVVVNETELEFYAGADPSEDVQVAATKLLGRAGQSIVVTLGAAGAIAVTDAGVVRVQGRAVAAIDATGAGDAFCGALAAALDRGCDMPRALAFANTAAALSTLRPGGAPSMPTRSEVTTAYGEDIPTS